MNVPEFCPNCGKKLEGLLSFLELRRHLDGKCISKKELAEKQEQRKIQPPLPLKGKIN